VGDQIIGVMECFSREVREPDEHFLEIWGPIGSQLGQYIERRRAEEAGQRSEALRGAILESALDCIISIDRRGNIIEFNPTSEKTFGYKRSETLGKSMADLIIPARFRERHHRGLAHYLATGEGPVIGKRIEIMAMRADGTEIPVELSINALEFGGEPVFTANLRDITERQKAAAELNEAQEKLRHHAEELEKRVEERTVNLREIIQSLDGFCYSIAHDLRAPLRALGGFSTELFNDYRAVLDDKGRDYVARIKDAAARMDQLISDLLKFGRLNTAELPTESLELGDTIRNALVSLEPDIKTKHATVVVKKPLLPVRGNAVMVEQALLNLIGNALKFVPPGTAPHVEIWTEQRQQRVRICVRDNGIGIKEEYGQKLFQPFVRLVDGKDYPGTGIGLAIVRKGVERMGGKAGFESQLGKGSCFWVELPAA
jgi:PAS domain S-box-containing protein